MHTMKPRLILIITVLIPVFLSCRAVSVGQDIVSVESAKVVSTTPTMEPPDVTEAPPVAETSQPTDAPSLPATTPSPDSTVWRKVRSPLFPSNWAPTAETVWARYTFAYGINPGVLMDGEYVTKPLSKTECSGEVVKTTVLSDEMAQAAIQGVIPIDEATRLILQNEKPVAGDCVNMTQLPDANLPKTKELLAYYRAWFKYNGAFLDFIRKDHADFIDWVISNE